MSTVFDRCHLRGPKSGAKNQAGLETRTDRKPKPMGVNSAEEIRRGKPKRQIPHGPKRVGTSAKSSEPNVLDLIAQLVEQDAIDFLDEKGIHAPVPVLDEDDPSTWTGDEIRAFLGEATK